MYLNTKCLVSHEMLNDMHVNVHVTRAMIIKIMLTVLYEQVVLASPLPQMKVQACLDYKDV